jgi:hypothetical protein
MLEDHHFAACDCPRFAIFIRISSRGAYCCSRVAAWCSVHGLPYRFHDRRCQGSIDDYPYAYDIHTSSVCMQVSAVTCHYFMSRGAVVPHVTGGVLQPSLLLYDIADKRLHKMKLILNLFCTRATFRCWVSLPASFLIFFSRLLPGVEPKWFPSFPWQRKQMGPANIFCTPKLKYFIFLYLFCERSGNNCGEFLICTTLFNKLSDSILYSSWFLYFFNFAEGWVGRFSVVVSAPQHRSSVRVDPS